MKKLYNHPTTESQKICFSNHVCIGSVNSNLNLNFTGTTGADPI